METPRLAIITPCYNEEEGLHRFFDTMLPQMEQWIAEGVIAENSYIVCADDGSKDGTWRVISEKHAADKRVKGLRLVTNRGQQQALIAAMHAVTDHCDICVTIDSDLQDDYRVIKDMVKHYNDGCDIVYGARSSRDSDTWFKRTTAKAFYRMQNAMGVKMVYNHSEFRMQSNRVLRMLGEYHERNIFLRGIIQQMGLKSAIVTYPLNARQFGETKYSFSTLLDLSVDGITSFTTKPMRWFFYIGFLFLIIDLIIGVWALVSYLSGNAVSGWTSLILSVWLLGSLILMGIGIIGEYIGKIYMEVKHRPLYNVAEKLFD